MTQEEKQLLLVDLSARLPYGVKVITSVGGEIRNDKEQLNFAQLSLFEHGYEDVKPYLFPLSSMTEEQREEFLNIQSEDRKRLLDALLKYKYEEDKLPIISLQKHIDWLNANQFDYRGLIPMGLAIDCTNLNIY